MNDTQVSNKDYRRLWCAVAVAAALWFVMFSPWTGLNVSFWVEMSVAALTLTTLALLFGKEWRSLLLPAGWPRQLLLGVALAAVLWGVFWVGDKLSQLMFGFARPQVDMIYGMKDGFPAWLIALLLVVLIGPAEELFWRGYVQRTLQSRMGDNMGMVVATLVYTLIHIWSFNFMLVMAALVCGAIWGLLYRLRPQWLPALVVSHAIWDAVVFVIFPI